MTISNFTLEIEIYVTDLKKYSYHFKSLGLIFFIMLWNFIF